MRAHTSIFVGLIVSALINIAGCAGDSPPAQNQATAQQTGANAAAHDIKRDHLALLTYGLLRSQNVIYIGLLKKRLGVESRSVAGCAIAGDQLLEINEYNRVMRIEIERRFGVGVLKRLRDESVTPPVASARAI